MALASALEFRSSLYILHLDFNKIDFAGVRALGRSLLVNQRCALQMAPPPPFSRLVTALQVFSSPSKLTSHPHAPPRRRRSLLVLTLAHNFLEDDAVCALAKALATNATLTKLDLQKVRRRLEPTFSTCCASQ